MWFIFTSFWNYKFYFVYGFMLLVYGILFVVTVCVTIVAVYYLLNGEDYRWWWLSFLSGGSWYVTVVCVWLLLNLVVNAVSNFGFFDVCSLALSVRDICSCTPSTIFLQKHTCMVFCKLPFILGTPLSFALVCF